MELAPEERQRIYLQEKARLEVRQELESKETSPWRVVIGSVFMVIVALSALMVIRSLYPTRQSKATTGNPSHVQYILPDTITLTASAGRDEGGATIISGTTNLPDGTKLGVELMAGGREIAQDLNVVVASGRFRSGGFRKANSPLPPGKQKVHLFTYFTTSWQPQTVLALVGDGGKKLKASAVIHSRDAQLIDGDNVLDYTADLVVPSLGSAHGKSTESFPVSRSPETRAIDIVKKAVLVVDGDRSSVNVEDGIRYYLRFPGLRAGDGWSAIQIAPNTFDVSFDFLDGDNKARAIWEVNAATHKVLYRNKSAKTFSSIPDYWIH